MNINIAGEERPKYELLSIALGTEFNECSIAAAELNKQVQNELAQETTQQLLYAVDDVSTIGKTYAIKKLNCELSANDDKFSLALIQRSNTPVVGRRRVFRRAVDTTVDAAGYEPQLVAIWNQEDVFIPLATFGRRQGGRCSYVQLGSEMKDDDLFVTMADENTSRQAIIETIRTTINESGGSNKNNNKLLEDLLSEDLHGKRQELNLAVEAMIVRRASERAVGFIEIQLQTIDVLEGGVEKGVYLSTSLVSDFRLAGSRSTELALTYNAEKTLQLLAITRGDIAVPLASFDRASGRVLFNASRQQVDDERRDQLAAIYKAVSATYTPPVYECDHLQERLGTRKSDYAARIIALRYLKSRGLIGLQEYNQKCVSKADLKAIDSAGIQTRVDDIIAEISLRHQGRDRSDLYSITHNVLDHYKKHLSNAVDIANRFYVSESFDALLGCTTSEEEALFRKTRAMSRRPGVYYGIAEQVKVGTTVGDANLQAEVSRDGTMYNVIISGSMLAMPDDEPRPIINLVFDAKQPLFNRKQYTNDLAASRAKDILEILQIFDT